MILIEDKTLYYISFYEFGMPFTGSLGGLYGMHYRVARDPLENVHWTPKEKRGEAVLVAEHWKGPYNYESTDKEKITRKEFEYSEEGKKEIADWLNHEYLEKYNKKRNVF